MPPAPSNRSLLLPVALISAAVLGYEVALTRVFAALLRYQFAFLVISLALCGLGLGGLLAHRFKISLPGAALAFGYAAAAALLLILRGVFAFIPDQYWVAALLVIVPFTCAGAFLSAAFSRGATEIGRLYGWDLAGAAIAAAGSVLLMQSVGAMDACLLFGALGGLAAIFLLEKPKPAFIVPALLLFLFWPLNNALPFGKITPAQRALSDKSGLWDVPPIPPVYQGTGYERSSLADRGVTQPLFTEIGDPKSTSRIIDTRWNAFARTDVVSDPGAGGSYLLYTNGNVPTNMVHWSGVVPDIKNVAKDFRLSDWTYSAARLKGQPMLAIGPGGGLDALLALYHGATSFDGAEINPSIVGLMHEPKYRQFNGGIYDRPEVHVVTAEGRAFVRDKAAQGKKYRMVFSALTKTATAGQGMALLESFIYTQDAFRDYLSVLDDDGQLAIVGDAPDAQRPLMLMRLFITAMSELQRQGMTQAQAGQHIAMMFDPRPGPYQWSLIVRKRPIGIPESARLREEARQRSIYPLWIPNQPSPTPVDSMMMQLIPVANGTFSTEARLSSIRAQGIELGPCPDNRPFVLDLMVSPWTLFISSPSLSILLGLAIFGTVVFAVLALGVRGRRQVTPGWILYFLGLGVGFMLVEIPLIQKLILPLGYPTLSLTVILFSLLLGGGAGALFSQKLDGNALRLHGLRCAIGVTAIAALLGLISDPLGNALLQIPLALRCGLIAVLILPLGFLLGTPFPAGIRLVTHPDPAAAENSVPLLWALNGTASVLGSIAAAVGAKVGGFTFVLAIGGLIYALVALRLFRVRY